MSFWVQSRQARHRKYRHQRRNEAGLARYSQQRGTRVKRVAIAGFCLISMLYMLELAAVIASVSTWCPTTSRTCN